MVIKMQNDFKKENAFRNSFTKMRKAAIFAAFKIGTLVLTYTIVNLQ